MYSLLYVIIEGSGSMVLMCFFLADIKRHGQDLSLPIEPLPSLLATNETNIELDGYSSNEDESWLSVVFGADEAPPSQYSIDLSAYAIKQDLYHLERVKSQLAEETLIEYADIDVDDKKKFELDTRYHKFVANPISTGPGYGNRSNNNNVLTYVKDSGCDEVDSDLEFPGIGKQYEDLGQSVDSIELYKETLNRRSLSSTQDTNRNDKKSKNMIKKVFSNVFGKRSKSKNVGHDVEVDTDCDLQICGKAMPIHQIEATDVPSLKLLCEILVNENNLPTTQSLHSVAPSTSHQVTGSLSLPIAFSSLDYEDGTLLQMCSEEDLLEEYEDEDEQVLQHFKNLISELKSQSHENTLQEDPDMCEDMYENVCEEFCNTPNNTPKGAEINPEIDDHETYLGALNNAGHMSPFLQSIANKYNLFSQNEPRWKLGVKRDESAAYHTQAPKEKPKETKELTLQEIKQATRVPSCDPHKYEKILRKSPVASRRTQEKAVSPSYRVLPPGTVKETVCKYEQMFVNDLVSDVIQDALNNLDQENISYRNQIEESIYQSQNEESILSENQTLNQLNYSTALSDQTANPLDYTTAMSDMDTDNSLLISVLSNNDLEEDNNLNFKYSYTQQLALHDAIKLQEAVSQIRTDKVLKKIEDDLYTNYDDMTDFERPESVYLSPLPTGVLHDIRFHNSPNRPQSAGVSISTQTSTEDLTYSCTPNTSLNGTRNSAASNTVDRATSPIEELNNSLDIGSCSIDLNTPTKTKPRYSSSPIKHENTLNNNADNSRKSKTLPVVLKKECAEKRKMRFSFKHLFQSKSKDPVTLTSYKKYDDESHVSEKDITVENKQLPMEILHYEDEPKTFFSPKKLKISISTGDLTSGTVGTFYDDNIATSDIPVKSIPFSPRNKPSGSSDTEQMTSPFLEKSPGRVLDGELIVIGQAAKLWSASFISAKEYLEQSSCDTTPSASETGLLGVYSQHDRSNDVSPASSGHCSLTELHKEISQIRQDIQSIESSVRAIRDEEQWTGSEDRLSEMASTDDMSLDSPNFSTGMLEDLQKKLVDTDGMSDTDAHLDSFIQAALKPIDDLLGTSEDDEPLYEGTFNFSTISKESAEKYPSFCYVSPVSNISNLNEEGDGDANKTSSATNVERNELNEPTKPEADVHLTQVKKINIIPASYQTDDSDVNSNACMDSQASYAPPVYFTQHKYQDGASQCARSAQHTDDRYPSFNAYTYLTDVLDSFDDHEDADKEPQENSGYVFGVEDDGHINAIYDESFEDDSSSANDVGDRGSLSEVIEEVIQDYTESTSDDYSADGDLGGATCPHYNTHSQSFERPDEIQDISYNCNGSLTDEFSTFISESDVSALDVPEQSAANLPESNHGDEDTVDV